MTLFALLLVFVGIAIGLAWYLIAHDRGQREPIYALWIAAGFGLLGGVVAAVIESWLVGNPDTAQGAALGTVLFSALLVGLIEELCKFLPLALWIYEKPYFNENTDGVIYFALAGLGFGLPENILYTLQFGAGTGMGRLILTPIFHAATTGLIGYFLVRYKMTKRSPVWVLGPLVSMILLHGLYDFGLMSGTLLFGGLSIVITISLSASLFMLYLKATKLDRSLGLSAVGNNSYCRTCGWANPAHHLYCVHCGKNA